jgi:hypothetical protein
VGFRCFRLDEAGASGQRETENELVMNDQWRTAQPLSRPARHGFLARFLDAMHDSRRRQAAREIEKYRDLIQKHRGAVGKTHSPPPSSLMHSETGCGSAPPRPGDAGHLTDQGNPDAAPAMSTKVKLLIVSVLVFFAILHVSAMVMMNQSDQTTPEAEFMYRTD